MKVDLINPFLDSTVNVISTMCQVKPVAGVPSLKKDNETWGVVTGIIGMSSEKLTGNMVVSFDQGSVLAIVSKMLMETFTEINDEILDAVGELTNMITGGAKQRLSEMGYVFTMASPLMVRGQGVHITQFSKAPVIQIPFSIAEGGFVVEANLATVS